jgi:hypothetical protein
MPTDTYAPWQHAARKMVAEACLAEWRKANPKPGRAHRPYTVPEWCQPLLDAVERDDEVETKRIMMVVRMGAYTLV